MKKRFFEYIDSNLSSLTALSDDLHDHPEEGFEEFYACEVLCKRLEDCGFKVEKGTGGLETAFRAEYEYGTGGPVIGFLGEYDALANLGHGCGHHLQTPAAIGAAMAIKELYKDSPYKLVIYGTPAEETRGGKIYMANAGCFTELDLVLSNHTGRQTGGCGANSALCSSVIEWTGTAAHAGGSPEKGRSALDAMMLAFHGLECMREHVRTGCRVHYTVNEGTGAANIVHPKASARVTLRSGDKVYLEDMVRRMRKVIEGSAMMTETEVKITTDPMFYDIVPNYALDKAVAANARACGAPHIEDHTEAELTNAGGGASDYGNVSYAAPGIMFTTYFCEAPGHTPEFVSMGKTKFAHDYLRNCACIMAGIVYDFLTDGDFRREVTEEYKNRLKAKGL